MLLSGDMEKNKPDLPRETLKYLDRIADESKRVISIRKQLLIFSCITVIIGAIILFLDNKILDNIILFSVPTIFLIWIAILIHSGNNKKK